MRIPKTKNEKPREAIVEEGPALRGRNLARQRAAREAGRLRLCLRALRGRQARVRERRPARPAPGARGLRHAGQGEPPGLRVRVYNLDVI